MTVVKILGEAGRLFAREVELDVSCPAEALHALSCMFPLWNGFLMESDRRGIRWKVITEDPKGLDRQQLVMPCSDRLIIAPIIGGKGDDTGILLAGAVLLGAGIGFQVSFLVNLGLSFIFQGLAALLSPTPRRPAERRQSFLFTGAEYRRSEQGNSVPILYGETMIRTPPVVSYGITLDRSRLGDAITVNRIVEGTVYPTLVYGTYRGFWPANSDVSGVWYSVTVSITFPVEGRYKLSFSGDDDARVYYGSVLLFQDADGYAGPLMTDTRFYAMGDQQFRIEGRNTIARGYIYTALFECVEAADGEPVTPLDFKEWVWSTYPDRVLYW